VLLDAGDFFGPGGEALVWHSGGVLSFCFGEGFEGVLQLLLKGRAGHRGKGITHASSQTPFMRRAVMSEPRISDSVPVIGPGAEEYEQACCSKRQERDGWRFGRDAGGAEGILIG
jgi:hypothetical protein